MRQNRTDKNALKDDIPRHTKNNDKTSAVAYNGPNDKTLQLKKLKEEKSQLLAAKARDEKEKAILQNIINGMQSKGGEDTKISSGTKDKLQNLKPLEKLKAIEKSSNEGKKRYQQVVQEMRNIKSEIELDKKMPNVSKEKLTFDTFGSDQQLIEQAVEQAVEQK